MRIWASAALYSGVFSAEYEAGIPDRQRATISEALKVDLANLFTYFLLSGAIRNPNYLLFSSAK
jgi:hypothetical protein